MGNIESIKLSYFSNEDLDALNSFELPEEQGQFTSLPTNFKEVTEGQHRIVIRDKAKPVGFFLLHSTDRVKEYSDNVNTLLLTALSINYSEQGKGYAKQAMLSLEKFVATEFPNCNEIILAVNQKNIAAQQLYLKVGFQDTGKRKMGPIGEQLVMNLMLQ